MFDFVREKKRLVQIVLAVIILPFAFWVSIRTTVPAIPPRSSRP